MPTQTQQRSHSSIDPQEVEQFSRIADEWWDLKGKFKPLHDINPLRINYIRDHLCRHFALNDSSLKPFSGLALVDIGCGGGLICEPMARLGAAVTGIDASEKNIAVAGLHASQMELAIDYRATTAEAEAETGRLYDVVLALEIIEHVTDPHAFIASCAALVKPGGLLVMSTLNRTIKSFAFAKVGAEYILRLLPRGTHQWQKFIRPSEMAHGVRDAGLEVVETRGMVINPFTREWRLSENDLDVNYLMVAKKK